MTQVGEKNIKDIVTSPDQDHHHQWSIRKDDWLSRSDRYGTGRTTTFLTVNLLTPVKHKAFCGVSYNNVSIRVLYLFVFVCLFIKCPWTGLDFMKYCLNRSRFFLAEMEGIKIVHQFDLREAVPENQPFFWALPKPGGGGGCPNWRWYFFKTFYLQKQMYNCTSIKSWIFGDQFQDILNDL